ncbi:MAG: hypothetical protein AAFR35_12410 [Pseudomonadota bacterium]
MGRILRILLFLIILAGVALVAYAYLGDLSPTQQDVVEPVDLDAS